MAEMKKEEAAGDAVDTSVFDNAKKLVFVAQMGLYLNVQWATMSDEDKSTCTALLASFYEQHNKFRAKPNQVSYPAFCKVLQGLEGKDKTVEKVMGSHGDRSTMGTRMKTLGFKLRGDTTLIECLLFIFGVTVADLVTKPSSPMDAELRKANAGLAAVTGAQQALIDAVTAAEALVVATEDTEAAGFSAIKAMKAKQALVKAKKDLDATKVSYRKELKAATKVVADAEAALTAEKSEGTEASKWLRAFCEKNHIPFTSY